MMELETLRNMIMKGKYELKVNFSVLSFKSKNDLIVRQEEDKRRMQQRINNLEEVLRSMTKFPDVERKYI